VQLPWNNPNDVEILNEHCTPPKLIFLKFEINPMVDLREIFFLIKMQRIIHGNYSMNSNYNYLLHVTFFHAPLFAHHSFHE
jgi:hypothetical protein